jgi:hypothetical protein
VIKWSRKYAEEMAGGAEALRNSDNLTIPSSTSAQAAVRALDAPTAFVVVIPAKEDKW